MRFDVLSEVRRRKRGCELEDARALTGVDSFWLGRLPRRRMKVCLGASRHAHRGRRGVEASDSSCSRCGACLLDRLDPRLLPEEEATRLTSTVRLTGAADAFQMDRRRNATTYHALGV